MKNRNWCWVLIVLAIIALPACLGPGNLGGQLGKWNVTEFENKWAQEGIFLLLLINVAGKRWQAEKRGKVALEQFTEEEGGES